MWWLGDEFLRRGILQLSLAGLVKISQLRRKRVPGGGQHVQGHGDGRVVQGTQVAMFYMRERWKSGGRYCWTDRS